MEAQNDTTAHTTLCFCRSLWFNFRPWVCCSVRVYNLMPFSCFICCLCLFCLFFLCSSLCCLLMLPRPLSLLWPPHSPLSEGRRRRWGGGGGGCGGDVPPRRRVWLGALHRRAAIPPPTYRGTSKPQKNEKHSERQRQEEDGSSSWLSCKNLNGLGVKLHQDHLISLS